MPIVLGTMLLALVAFCVCKMRRKRRAKLPLVSVATTPFDYRDTDGKDLELTLFDLSTIVAATDNFSANKKLGGGGFGPIFMGKLQDGQPIAVKRLAKTSVRGSNEFRNELELIAKFQHRNLVRLLGCCIHMEEKMLIYEYMPNKSLDVFLFGKKKIDPSDTTVLEELRHVEEKRIKPAAVEESRDMDKDSRAGHLSLD